MYLKWLPSRQCQSNGEAGVIVNRPDGYQLLVTRVTCCYPRCQPCGQVPTGAVSSHSRLYWVLPGLLKGPSCEGSHLFSNSTSFGIFVGWRSVKIAGLTKKEKRLPFSGFPNLKLSCTEGQGQPPCAN